MTAGHCHRRSEPGWIRAATRAGSRPGSRCPGAPPTARVVAGGDHFTRRYGQASAPGLLAGHRGQERPLPAVPGPGRHRRRGPAPALRPEDLAAVRLLASCPWAGMSRLGGHRPGPAGPRRNAPAPPALRLGSTAAAAEPPGESGTSTSATGLLGDHRARPCSRPGYRRLARCRGWN